MSNQQALWRLDPGQALSFKIGPGARELQVTAGRVWLTEAAGQASKQGAGKEGQLPADVWLQAGESLRLASGTQVLLEGWPSAQFQLLVPPCPELAEQQQRRRATAGRAQQGAMRHLLASSWRGLARLPASWGSARPAA
ncbi:DUF2917 domain-containing protein [Roseateles sp. PN1]|uniref:DUF2917 domain-containing protein n=1 Tax=Roseateles sp. PN1 TaxID=3137372 RepID=UPI00313A3CBF